MPEIVEFLLTYPPFSALGRAEVEGAAAFAEIEFHLAGTEIFSQGAKPTVLRVIRAGAVEIIHDGRVLDLIGVGEMFGHASMLSGLPTGFAARAAEDTLTYRIPADVAYGLLGQPATLRYVTRSLLEDRYGIRQGRATEVDRNQLSQPVAALIRAPAVICQPGTPISEAAREMSARGATAVVVDLGSSLGILTDRDLRSRVLAVGLAPDTPVSKAMTAPAETVPSDRLAGEVLLDMLDRGFRHFPVLSPTGSVLGVIGDSDLVEVQTHSSFSLRRAIARAGDVGELAEAAAALRPMIVSLHRARVAPLDIEAVFSIVSDALTRRALEFAFAGVGDAPVAFAWLALGSQARREAVPSSDLDSAVVFLKQDDSSVDVDEVTRPYFAELAQRATEILVACGFHPDEHRASASDPLFVRSLDSWQTAGRSWLEDPTQDKALVLTSVLVDSRPVFGAKVGEMLTETFRPAREHPALLRMLAMGAGLVCASTPQRLRAASEAGILSQADADTLIESFELVSELRLDHQSAQLMAGEEPDDFVDPGELSVLTRTYLKEAFRAVAAVQHSISNDLAFGVR